MNYNIPKINTYLPKKHILFRMYNGFTYFYFTIYQEPNTRTLLQDWVIIFITNKLIQYLSDFLVPGCPKRIFLIHSDIKSKTKPSLIYWVL